MGILGHVSQITTQRIYIYIYRFSECLFVKHDQAFPLEVLKRFMSKIEAKL